MILMKTGNACFLLLMCVSLLFTSCGNSQSKKGEENKVGDDKDAHGCIASAGYTWSEVLKDCIRLWEMWQIKKKPPILFFRPIRCK